MSVASDSRWRRAPSAMNAADDRGLEPLNQKKFMCGLTLTSTKRKHLSLFRLLSMTTIPALIVIIQNSINLHEDVEMFRANTVLKANILFSIEVGKVIHRIQIERGTTALYVSSGGDPFIKQRLVSMYKQTELSIRALPTWIAISEPPHFRSIGQFRDYIWIFRNALNPFNITLREVIGYYTAINTVLEVMMGKIVNIESPFNFWTDLTAYELIIISKEQAGIERALGSTYYTRGHMPTRDLLWYNEKNVLGVRFLEQCLKFSNFAQTLVSRNFLDTELVEVLEIMRNEIRSNKVINPSLLSGTRWFDNMTNYIDMLKTVHDQLAAKIVQRAGDDINYLENKLIASAIQLTIAIIMMPIIVVLVRNVISYSGKLKERTNDLEEEKRQTETLLRELDGERKRTEELLYQLLPKSVAKTLLENGSTVPEFYDSATIMFSDVVGFTNIASVSTPMEVVLMLNKLYMTIDENLENFDVYKVETIGDAYMVASGLPNRNGDRHVEEIARLALSLLKALEQMRIPHKKNEKIRLRIGINSGPCVAGVVGIKMPRYCIFGDTVNTASRMESTGLPLRIQMTESSTAKLRQTGGFVISERGHVDVKGKGLMLTYWLERLSTTLPTGDEMVLGTVAAKSSHLSLDDL